MKTNLMSAQRRKVLSASSLPQSLYCNHVHANMMEARNTKLKITVKSKCFMCSLAGKLAGSSSELFKACKGIYIGMKNNPLSMSVLE